MRFLTEFAIAFGHIAATKIAGSAKAVLANLSLLEDEDGGEREGSSEEPLYGPWGWYGRPKAPVKAADATPLNPEGQAEVLALRHGDQAQPIVGRDLRLSSQVNPKEGEVGLIQYGGGFISLADNADANGTAITIYALRKKSTGEPDKASMVAIDSAAANPSISILHESGASISINKDAKIAITNKNGDAYVEVNDSGVVINGASVAITGGAMIGDSDPAAGDFLLKATDGLQFSAQVIAAITQIAALLNTAGPVVGAPGSVTPVTTPLAPTTATKAK